MTSTKRIQFHQNGGSGGSATQGRLDQAVHLLPHGRQPLRRPASPLSGSSCEQVAAYRNQRDTGKAFSVVQVPVMTTWLPSGSDRTSTREAVTGRGPS
jgi:hypothetical protein